MTADLLDSAQELTQAMADRKINDIRIAAAEIDTSNPSGECLWCFEPTGHERRFCDKDCAADWDAS